MLFFSELFEKFKYDFFNFFEDKELPESRTPFGISGSHGKPGLKSHWFPLPAHRVPHVRNHVPQDCTKVYHPWINIQRYLEVSRYDTDKYVLESIAPAPRS
jgi:hypothetical protein